MASLLEHHGWYEWICHTNFSFKLGASHPQELVTAAAAAHYRGLAITDFDGVYGLSRSLQAAERLRKEQVDHGLRLFYGAELHMTKDHALPVILQDTLVLVARSHLGYFNLCRLVTFAHRAGKLEADLPLDHLLASDVTDLVAIQPMRGLVNQRGGGPPWRSKCQRLRDHFGSGSFFLAASRHLNQAEDYPLKATIRLAKELGVNCLLTQDAFFHHPSQKDLSDLLHAIRVNRPVGEAVEHVFVNAERSLHGLKNIESRFKNLPIYETALAASQALAETCVFSLRELRYQYPKEMLPEGYSALEFLDKITWEGARSRYGGVVPDKVTRILRHELGLVDQLQFADYFLTVWDIVRWARSQHILCQGRGSAANSAICFVLGITSVDPALFDVLFERFISAERGDPPDIDVDFEHERREEVIQYIYERYGRHKAAMVANIITFRSRGALRAAGKALGIPEVIIGKGASLLDSREFRQSGSGATMDELQKLLAEEGSIDDCRGIPWSHWASMAARLEGFPSHLGIHSGGFVLTGASLDWLCPQEPATMPGRSVIQWCKEDIEALGFFKIDILALGMLTAVRKCLELVESHYGETLTLATIPQDDTPTYDMICRADTVGTFQIESRAQMSMLPRLKPRCFYDLVIEVAIIRPGPIQGGMIHPFLRRREGLEEVSFPDPRLVPILSRTLGIPIFQEQVMRIAMAVGGFSPGDADELRRNIGSFSLKGDVSRWVGRLAEGMRANGIPEPFIESILEQLKGFSSYGFPESHSASFALIAYVSCYLKCHYPEAFFVSVINSQPMGFYSLHVLLQTARHLGITVQPVCVNRSAWDCTLEPAVASGGRRYDIRMGLSLVRSLREETAKDFIARRQKQGAWSSVEAFVGEAGLSRVDLTALAAADALRVFGIQRRSAIWLAEAAPFCPYLEDVESRVAFANESDMERMQLDFHVTGTSLGVHPTEILKTQDWCYGIPKERVTVASDIPRVRPGQQVVVFGMVIVRQAPPSAKGMVFATIEDETGLINIIFTPQVYGRWRHLFDRQAFLCVQGPLQSQGDAYSVKAAVLIAPQIKEAAILYLNGEPAEEPVGALAREKALIPSRNYC